jgi:hypothetical protein
MLGGDLHSAMQGEALVRDAFLRRMDRKSKRLIAPDTRFFCDPTCLEAECPSYELPRFRRTIVRITACVAIGFHARFRRAIKQSQRSPIQS